LDLLDAQFTACDEDIETVTDTMCCDEDIETVTGTMCCSDHMLNETVLVEDFEELDSRRVGSNVQANVQVIVINDVAYVDVRLRRLENSSKNTSDMATEPGRYTTITRIVTAEPMTYALTHSNVL